MNLYVDFKHLTNIINRRRIEKIDITRLQAIHSFSPFSQRGNFTTTALHFFLKKIYSIFNF
jgi:hypothetical protein